RRSPTLRDFRHARARPLDGDGSRGVLEVVRGGIAPEPAPELRIYFNLTGEDRTLPDRLEAGGPSFRSEVDAYGAPARRPDAPPARLAPHEFVIVGDLGGFESGATA
ncbi:MAG TPA: hypothetical protein VKP69_11435, partial [Isosphaeraceae bacterium]|nr:hypothetical protein [Isosphaeraceae bacterium]